MSETPGQDIQPERLKLSDHIPPASVVGDFAEWLTVGGGFMEIPSAIRAVPEIVGSAVLGPADREAGG